MRAPHRRARGRSLIPVVVVTALAVSACGGGGDGAEAVPTTREAAATTTSVAASSGRPGEGPFCTSIAAIQGLGAGEAAGATPDQVLAQNEALLDLLDEATASVPEGAPADVEALFDDYRTIAVAIGSAGGDVEAAYTALQRDEPELADRLFTEAAHLPAFEFFEAECGIRSG